MPPLRGDPAGRVRRVRHTERHPRRLCGGWDGLGDAAPLWFGAVFDRFFDVVVPVVRLIMFRGKEVGTVIASLDWVAAVTGAWQQVRVMAGMAVAIALGMCLLAALAVGHALLPVQAIMATGLRRLEAGDHASRLPGLRITEFRRIAEAVNDLADRLERTTAERTRADAPPVPGAGGRTPCAGARAARRIRPVPHGGERSPPRWRRARNVPILRLTPARSRGSPRR